MSAAAPEFEEVPADGQVEQRLGARAKARTPAHMWKDDRGRCGHALYHRDREVCAWLLSR